MASPYESLPPLQLLLLAGGSSSRMQSPKHLLRHPSGLLMYVHSAKLLTHASPDTPHVHISLASSSSTSTSTSTSTSASSLPPIPGISTRFLHDTRDAVGPAAGLLAAHDADPRAAWLVLACDYPLMPVEGLQQLVERWQRARESVVCFQNADGWIEPLIAVWSPEALAILRERVAEGKTGPAAVVREVQGQVLVPGKEVWIMGTNTREEWDAAVRYWHDGGAGGKIAHEEESTVEPGAA